MKTVDDIIRNQVKPNLTKYELEHLRDAILNPLTAINLLTCDCDEKERILEQIKRIIDYINSL